MTSAQIRQSFLDFFREKQHTIVPSSSLLPDAPNLLFTNAGMNQFVPIFLGEQSAPWNPPRTVDTQKCIRAGGKHNDLDDVGLDTYHHTFFEMLGNWCFGDYFKKEAIAWAWELVIERWKLPAAAPLRHCLQARPGRSDRVRSGSVRSLGGAVQEGGLDPAVHIVNGNKKDNFWMMGDTGPCGPCSELHFDLTPNGDTRGSLVNAGDARCIEIWNLVFIQFNANPDGTSVRSPRGTSIPAWASSASPRYPGHESSPIFRSRPRTTRPTSSARSSTRSRSSAANATALRLPKAGSTGDTEQEKIDIAFRVIADHIRTLSFAIADGIQPGNEGRDYVLRRILRRAVRYGRTLGFHEPFFYKLVDVLVATMGDVFPESRTKQHCARSLQREEEASTGPG